jgi:hypothetical protein
VSAVALSPQEQEMVGLDIGAFAHDPLGYVKYVYPWKDAGPLEKHSGPRTWQARILADVAAHLGNPETRFTPFKAVVSSGHGIGKSTIVAWLIGWALDTFGDSRVIVTANTKGQLDTKTQPEASKWFRMALTTEQWDVNVASIKSSDPAHERTWRCDFNPWSEENAQAFAGAHNQGKRIVIIMDEASEIASVISAEVGRGALTDSDTEILWFKFGNPTLNTGDFYDCAFGNQRHRWNVYVIDSREVEGTNKEEIAEWEQDYGEDSDFFRVRVRGLPPRAASGQFIDLQTIQDAQRRPVFTLPDDPLVAGFDAAWGGADDNIVRFRKGNDARSIPSIKVKGEFTRNPSVMVGKLADVLSKTYNGDKVAMLFIDSAGIAGPIAQRLRALGHRNIMEVNFGQDSTDPKYAYRRDEMWGKMKAWLQEGGAIDKDPGLEADLSKPILVEDRLQRVKLEPKDVMKKRLAKMGADSSSPDDGDALALTFAMPVLPKEEDQDYGPPPKTGVWS